MCGVTHEDESVAHSSPSILSKAQGGVWELVDGCILTMLSNTGLGAEQMDHAVVKEKVICKETTEATMGGQEEQDRTQRGKETDAEESRWRQKKKQRCRKKSPKR